jgi:CRP-like cAMP-binding protein
MWILDQAGAGDRLLLNMNREELADYLGTTRPSLSRELMNMQEDGLIDVSRSRILINDREELEQYSG